MSVRFVQFLMPDGRKRAQFIELSPKVEARAAQISASGLQFEMEMLSDFSTCSFTITHPEKGDLAIELCQNGPDVPKAITKLIMEFDLQIHA